MWRARFLLLAIIVVLPVTEYFLYEYLADTKAKEGSGLLLYFFLNTIAVITLVPSAILLLLSTLFKIQVANDETLRYDPKNLFWALMRKLWGDTWGDPISLCKAFWLTALSILMIIVVIFFIAAVALIFYHIPEGDPVSWKFIAYVLGVIFGEFFLFFVGIKLLTQKTKTSRVYTKTALGVIALFMCFTGVPFFLIMYKGDISFVDAFFKYLNGVYELGKFLGLIALIFIGIGLIMNFVIPRLKNTVFSHFLIALKEKMCPLLFEKDSVKI